MVGGTVGGASGTAVGQSLGGAIGAIVGAGLGGAAGSVFGASITATPQTRVVRPTTREVVYIEGRPGERTGHRRQGRDD
jgi:outer membrane lipoprotein SlyB